MLTKLSHTLRNTQNGHDVNQIDPLFNRLKALNGERSRLAQSFEYNYGDFIPILRPFLRGYLKICKEVKERRLQLFKDYFVEERKYAFLFSLIYFFLIFFLFPYEIFFRKTVSKIFLFSESLFRFKSLFIF